MFVKPAPGRSVRWPGTMRPLRAQGENVPETTFWLLCERNGDVIKATPPEASAPAVVSTPPLNPSTDGAAAKVEVPA